MSVSPSSMRGRVLLLVLFFFASPSSRADSVKEIIEVGVRPFLAHHYSLAVGVLKGGESSFFGFSENTDETIPNERHIFGINSMTKVMVDVMLAQMVTTGTLQLEDPVQKFYLHGRLPLFEGAPFNFFSLATHSSGLARLPDNFVQMPSYDPYAKYTDREMFDYLSDAALNFRPTSQYSYSNMGFGLLGCVLSGIDGTTFARMLETRLSEPLGLVDTRAFVDYANAARIKQGHTPFGEPLPPRSGPECLAGSWAVRSTAKDMLTFLGYQLAPETSPFHAALELSQSPTGVPKTPGVIVGYGWDIRAHDRTYSSAGGGGGFSSVMLFNRQKQVALVLLSTSDPTEPALSISSLGWRLMNQLLR